VKNIILTLFVWGLLFGTSQATTKADQSLVCDGKGNCQTEAEYQAYLKSPDYYCKYYAKYIWKESERAYGKKQYAYTEEDLQRIKLLKDEGIALCEAGNRSDGEARMLQAIKIISFTPTAK
jgi:hypothetical protein